MGYRSNYTKEELTEPYKNFPTIFQQRTKDEMNSDENYQVTKIYGDVQLIEPKSA